MTLIDKTSSVDTELSQKSYPIREAFSRFYPIYKKKHLVSTEQEKAAFCISHCKTGALGYNIAVCEDCGNLKIHASSCNNRHCPSCQVPQEHKWVLARTSELIDGCAYYHVIFTLPHELNDLVYLNQKLLYNLLFSTVQNTLLSLCRDEKYLGATPGILMVLHTWGQQLNFHPHIHTCITGGGLTPSNQFVEGSHKGFFIPVKVIGRLFRGKFLDALKKYYEDGTLNLSDSCADLADEIQWKLLIDRLYKKDWVPFIKETFNGNGNAIKYLARYAFRTAISNSRITQVTDSSVSFRYKDYRDASVHKSKTVTGTEFIRLFLQHILPSAFSRIRFAGFLSNACKTKKLKLIHKLRNTTYRENPVKGISTRNLMILLYKRDICSCDKCKGHLISYPRGTPIELVLHTRSSCTLT